MFGLSSFPLAIIQNPNIWMILVVFVFVFFSSHCLFFIIFAFSFLIWLLSSNYTANRCNILEYKKKNKDFSQSLYILFSFYFIRCMLIENEKLMLNTTLRETNNQLDKNKTNHSYSLKHTNTNGNEHSI